MKSAKCSICDLETLVTSQLVPYQNEGAKSHAYLFFSCCNYFKQETFLSDEEMTSLYESDYGAFNLKKESFIFIMNVITKKRVRNFKNYITNKDVLEIGSGTGEFLYYSKSYQPKSMQGVEVSEYASSIAKEKYNVDIVCSTIESFSTVKKFDTIFMFHVIEHVTDPIAVISKCNSLLKDRGVLIMETPNHESFERKFYQNNWAGWSVPFHTFIHSPQSLIKASERSGLTVNEVYYAPFSNTYSYLIPFLLKTRNIILLPYLALKFVYKTLRAPFNKESGTMTIIAMKPASP